MTDHSQAPQATAENQAGESLALQLTLTMAARLARKGRHQQVEQLLATLPDGQRSSPPVLDLMARSRAQRGDLLGAAQSWRVALQQDPGNAAYRAALDRIDAMLSRAGSRRGLGPVVAVVAVAALAVMGGLWLDSRLHQIQDAGSANMQALSDTVGGIDRHQAALVQRLDDIGTVDYTWVDEMEERSDAIEGRLAAQAEAIDGMCSEVNRLRSSRRPSDARVAPAGLPADVRQRLDALLTELQANRDVAGADGLRAHSGAIADLATSLWRMSKAMVDAETGEPRSEVRDEYRSLEAALDAMREVGVEVHDYTGEPLPENGAGDITVLGSEPTSGISHKIIKATITPAVYLDGERIQMAGVIVATPDSQQVPADEEQ